jgi:hypothetical protein
VLGCVFVFCTLVIAVILAAGGVPVAVIMFVIVIVPGLTCITLLALSELRQPGAKVSNTG